MSRCLSKISTHCLWSFTAAALSLLLLAGCARSPSREELSLLEQKRQGMEAAEKEVVEKKAEKARLERKLADKKAEKKALEDKRAATKSALTSWPKE